MSIVAKDRLWWIGVPVAALFISFLPYWAWNILGGVTDWWRIRAVTPGIFDTYVYLSWMGSAAEGLPYGGHMKWLGPMLLQPIWSVIGRFATVPELWILSRSITFALTVWISAWAFETWSGLQRHVSRLLAVGFFFAVIFTLGMRPGVYSWYLPFCIAGLTCVLLAWRALTRASWVIAALWSVAALALTWLYPWFFMIAGLWIAVAWSVTFIRRRRWVLPAVIGVTIVVVVLGAESMARWFLDPSQAGLIGMYERNGMAFSRVPFLANTILVISAWILLALAAARRSMTSEHQKRLVLLGGGWISVLLLWFHTPFVGMQIYSDHFIGPVTTFGWISLAVVWGWLRTSDLKEERSVALRHVPLIVTIGAVAFFVYILQQPLRMNLWRFDSYVIHLVNWFALAVTAAMITWRTRFPALPSDRTIILVVFISSVLIGIGGFLPAFLRDLPLVSRLQDRIPVIAWIRQETSSDARLCADPDTASFYAAHTGRHISPAEAVMSWPLSSEQIIRNLQTIVRSYDVRGAGQTDTFRFLTDHYRTVSCAYEGEYSRNERYVGLLRWLGFSEERMNDVMGCDRRTLDEHRTRMDAAIDEHATDLVEFPRLCPYVIMPFDQKSYWHLPPGGYVEHRITSDISVWQKK